MLGSSFAKSKRTFFTFPFALLLLLLLLLLPPPLLTHLLSFYSKEVDFSGRLPFERGKESGEMGGKKASAQEEFRDVCLSSNSHTYASFPIFHFGVGGVSLSLSLSVREEEV